MDWLGVTGLVGNVVNDVANAANPYFYTDQEKAGDALTATSLANQQAAITASAAAAAAKEQTNQKAITYGLAGVLGLGGLFLASKVIGGR